MNYKLIHLKEDEVLYEENDFQYNVCTGIRKNGNLVMTPLLKLTEKKLRESPSINAIICNFYLKKTTRETVLKKLSSLKKLKLYVLFLDIYNKECVGWIQDETKNEYVIRLITYDKKSPKKTTIVPKSLCYRISSQFVNFSNQPTIKLGHTA